MASKLKKELSLFTATFYGIGIILGAGIYVLIGEGAGIAGDALWMAFVVAAFLATFTGLSYAELSSMFPKAAAEYVYTKKAFNINWLSFVAQWLMVFAVIMSSATVALGFGRYFYSLTGIGVVPSAMGLLAALSLLNWYGIKESAKFNVFSTFVEMSGLLIVIAIGAFFISGSTASFFTPPSTGVSGIMAATALLFFAYIGFEDLVNMSEETKNASRTIPKALIIAIAVSTLLYILVSIASVAVIGSAELAAAEAPLTAVVSAAMPNAGILMSLIALFATSNTVLALLVVGSRMLYGLACNNAFPAALKKVGKRQTPYVSVFAVFVVSLMAIVLGGIKSIALLTDIGIFAVYIFVNAAVIAMRYKMPSAKRPFRMPLNIGKFPVLAALGLATSAVMLFHFETKLMVYELAVVAIGLAIYGVFGGGHSEKFAKLFRKSEFTTKQKDLIATFVRYPMKIADLMVKNVKTVELGDTVKNAAKIMNKNKIGSIIVAMGDEALGIITERDILKKIVASGKNPAKIRCKEIMSDKLLSVDISSEVVDAIEMMTKHKIKKLVVTKNGKLIGIVSITDILQSGEKIEYAVMKKLAETFPMKVQENVAE